MIKFGLEARAHVNPSAFLCIFKMDLLDLRLPVNTIDSHKSMHSMLHHTLILFFLEKNNNNKNCLISTSKESHGPSNLTK